jgi:putative acetyltransferase
LSGPPAIIRDERPEEAAAIRSVIVAAFALVEHSSQTEAAIVEALRAAGVLTVSLVAIEGGALVGYVAFSPVAIDGHDLGWFGLGPLAVRPDCQGRGIGVALVRAGLDRLRTTGAKGCVLVGEPGYYGRFGFRAHLGLRLIGVPPEYFLALPFAAELPRGQITYHEGFEARPSEP